MKKNLITLMAFLSALAVIFIAILNVKSSIPLQIWGPETDGVTGTLYPVVKNINTALFSFLVFGGGLFVGLALFMPFYNAQDDKLNAYKRELEKSSVKTDSSSSQVKVLEAKIEVLERALKEALNK